MTLSLLRVMLLGASVSTAGGAVLVATEPGVEAYAAAVEGIGSTLGPGACRVVEIRAGVAGFGRALSAPDVQLVIAVGARALVEVTARHPEAPVIAAMVLHDERSAAAARIELEIPLAAQLEAIRGLWPGRVRLGLVRNPARARHAEEDMESTARRHGFTARILDCDGPARLIRAVSEAKDKVDFLLCLPDPDLYNAVTIKPFVLAALEARLPIVGFSPAFVRAGAAAGIYADYREIGRQAAEMAARRLRGADLGPDEFPRKIRVAVNQRIVRLLGLNLQPGLPNVEVMR